MQSIASSGNLTFHNDLDLFPSEMCAKFDQATLNGLVSISLIELLIYLTSTSVL